MRLASFNVENLFARPKAMSEGEGDEATRRAAMTAHSRLSELLTLASYDGHQSEILEHLTTLGLLKSDEGPFVRLRKIRGRLLARPKTGSVEVVAAGRGGWIGWVELKTVAVNAEATRNTARVIAALSPDILTVIEADNRPGLQLFSDAVLREIEYSPFEQVMVVEGNDLRGIDVGLMARKSYRLTQIRTHVFDEDKFGTIFSRDCCEYHFQIPRLDSRLVVLANHFKSKGYSSPDDPLGAKRRMRQAKRVAGIVRDLRNEGVEHIDVTGDLNDSPASPCIKLLKAVGLRDVSEHNKFNWDGRRGTYGSGNENDKIDYILMSDPLFSRVNGGGVFRKGVWRGNRTKNPWEIFPTLTSKLEEASDHAAIYADLQDF